MTVIWAAWAGLALLRLPGYDPVAMAAGCGLRPAVVCGRSWLPDLVWTGLDAGSACLVSSVQAPACLI